MFLSLLGRSGRRPVTKANLFRRPLHIESLEERTLLAAAVVAGYQDDFQEVTPAPGWEYLWNEGGAIGDADNYTPLLWNNAPVPLGYDVDGTPANPAPDPGRWAIIREFGGHPGAGVATDGGVDRYVIAAYTVSGTADYAITDGFLRTVRSDGPSNGVELRVYVNDTFVPGSQLIVSQLSESPFSVPLGTVNAGDTIYVAIGPNGHDWFDSFHMDYTIKVELTAQFDQILDDLIALDLPNNLRNGLIGKINAAKDILEDDNLNNDHAATNKFNDFIKQVDDNKKIDDDDEETLIDATQIILDLLDG